MRRPAAIGHYSPGIRSFGKSLPKKQLRGLALALSIKIPRKSYFWSANPTALSLQMVAENLHYPNRDHLRPFLPDNCFEPSLLSSKTRQNAPVFRRFA
jgi:hypothetical protein